MNQFNLCAVVDGTKHGVFHLVKCSFLPLPPSVLLFPFVPRYFRVAAFVRVFHTALISVTQQLHGLTTLDRAKVTCSVMLPCPAAL